MPAIFGMNFQAVSVGQKLIESGVKGGYTDAAGDPTPSMLGEIEFVDAAIGQMVDCAGATSTFSIPPPSSSPPSTANRRSTPTASSPFPDILETNGMPPSQILAALLPVAETTGLGPTEDDISQLWLKNSSDTLTAVGMLESQRERGGHRPDLLWRFPHNDV